MQIRADWLQSPASVAVLGALERAGKRAYFVGGCVRNALLDAPVADLDIATDAPPAETQRIMAAAGLKTLPTGIEHGTVTALSGGLPYEITTFRRDVETDGRRAVVAFSMDITEDARRRDFTMNALYADGAGRVIDPLNGLPDLQARRVRFIEDADLRIAEDHLRILRFFRFHAWYGDPAGGIDADGLAACAAGVEGIGKLSKERIGAEMRKLLLAVDPAPALASMANCGVLMRVLPGADAQMLAPLVHLEQLAEIAPDWRRRLAVLGGEDAQQNLRLSKQHATYLHSVHKILTGAIPPAEAGFRFGFDSARDSVLVLAASLSHPVADADIAEAKRGSEAVFPVQSSDLQPRLSGKALGDELRRLRRKWFASGLKAQRAELLD